MTTRRKFLKGAAVAGPATLAAPSILHAQEPIRWRFQTYAGSALGEEVTKPAIDAINAETPRLPWTLPRHSSSRSLLVRQLQPRCRG